MPPEPGIQAHLAFFYVESVAWIQVLMLTRQVLYQLKYHPSTYSSHFIDEKTWDSEKPVTCPRPHTEEAAKLVLETRSGPLRSLCPFYHIMVLWLHVVSGLQGVPCWCPYQEQTSLFGFQGLSWLYPSQWFLELLKVYSSHRVCPS